MAVAFTGREDVSIELRVEDGSGERRVVVRIRRGWSRRPSPLPTDKSKVTTVREQSIVRGIDSQSG